MKYVLTWFKICTYLMNYPAPRAQGSSFPLLLHDGIYNILRRSLGIRNNVIDRGPDDFA